MAKASRPAKSVAHPTVDKLSTEYSREVPRAKRLLECLGAEFGDILQKNDIALGVPIEARIKEWASISEKIERKSLRLDAISDLQDLVGLRIILLFRGDLKKLDEIIRSTLNVVSVEDTSDRLGESQFGYQSQHYIVKVPEAWLSVPRYEDIGSLQAELQVRTLAQHIWAAASHKLQYKREESVPPPIRRAIYRVSALLETVDLEFDRVLAERSEYMAEGIDLLQSDAKLNVDLLAAIARSILPQANEEEGENFGELLDSLMLLKVTTAKDLTDLLKRHKGAVIAFDQTTVRNHGDVYPERKAKGVYFTLCGLVRRAMIFEFGEEEARKAIKAAEPNDAENA